MNTKTTALVALLAVLAFPSAARELAGVTLPDSVSVGDTKLALNGLGLREATFLKVDVYVAGLYLEKPNASADAILAAPGPKQLRLHFVRALTRDEIVKAWREGVAKNAGNREAAVRDRFEKLYAAMIDVAKGDVMVLTQDAGDAVTAGVGDRELARLSGRDFADVLWSIWLGPSPPNPELKEGLLGKLSD